MRRLNALLVCCPLVFAVALPAAALPRGPNGETCASSETNVRHEIRGQSYSCDRCEYLKCNTSGTHIDNCQRVTHFSNCVAAQATRPTSPKIPKGNVGGRDPANNPATSVPPKINSPSKRAQ